MNMLKWLRSRLNTRHKSMSAYKRGMKKAKLGDQEGAIEEYTLAIGLPETPPDVRAMALYNRALVLSTTGKDSMAVEDLNVILAMKQDLTKIKTEARRRLLRLQKRRGTG